jgi:hypothetical protein
MGCGCKKKRTKYRAQIKKMQEANKAKVSPKQKEEPQEPAELTPKQKRILARNKRMKRRNERIRKRREIEEREKNQS